MSGDGSESREPAFLTRVGLRNYRSIAACDVQLGPLTFLVGPNGSGKSNFLDSLRFVSDALHTSLEHALRERGGAKEVRRRAANNARHFGLRLEFSLGATARGHFAFKVGPSNDGGFRVLSEECEVVRAGTIKPAGYDVREGVVRSISTAVTPPASADRLFLTNAAGLPEFREVFDRLSQMEVYNIDPGGIRSLQAPDAGAMLARTGFNAAAVLSRLSRDVPDTKHRIETYLGEIVAGLTSVRASALGPVETVEFEQKVEGASKPFTFLAANMSDGTLRALGILIALFQARADRSSTASVVGIEEPETALHPAAAGILLAALREASRRTQVIVTSHSPDLLDDEAITDDLLLAVSCDEGETRIARIDAPGRDALRSRLYTAGELLKLGQLAPDPAVALTEKTARQLRLFDSGEDPSE